MASSTSISGFTICSNSQSEFLSSKSSRYAFSNSLPRISFQLPTHFPALVSSAPRVLSSFVKQNIASLLIGSFIFVGSFSNRAAMAALTPPPAAVHTEEKTETEEEMCQKILENDPKNVEALKVVLYGKIRRGKAKEAVKLVESLIKVEPNEVEWRLLLALCYETMGHFTTSKRLFKEILRQRPLFLRALHGLAMVMHKNHEGRAVFEMLDKARELASRQERVTEERNIRILIAQMFVVQGDLEEGLKRFQDLVNENPRDFRPYLCQGIIYSLLDKKEEAAQQFETYQSLVPEEFPQRGFLDDVALSAKATSREQFMKEYSYRK
ncbi:protein SLOW GREEN 1, chloroplastic [Arachis stenosperma]|uniref:protein SLOW GREEN 1, chloroplastic n=1 Tax=Arachis stenosperma TaxID=217475 RepID=UPI0025AC7219|nr:protein SLOW GREEN 1, chloroplastic [Arachis stenosperma]